MSTQQRNQTMEEALISTFMAPSLWLDYTDKSTLVKTGNSVTAWKDKTNNGRVASTTGTAPIDDGTGIKFGTANNTNLVVPGFFTNINHPGFTIILVRKPNADTPAPNIDVNYAATNYYTTVFDDYKRLESVTPNTIHTITGTGTFKMGNFGKDSSYSNQTLIETSRFGNGQRTFAIDYRIQTRKETGSLTISGDFILGTQNPNGFKARQTFSEVLVFPRFITDEELITIIRYLDRKYSITTTERKDFTNSQIHFIGDSLTVGWGDDTGMGYSLNYPNQTMALLGSGIYRNIAVGGFTVSQLTTLVQANTLTAYSNRYDKNVCNVWIGSNDIQTSNKTGAQMGQEIGVLCQLLRNQGWKVAVTTVLPRTASNTVPDNETRRVDLNNYLAANFSTFADGFVDLRTDPLLNDPLAPNNTAVYDVDKVHLKGAGYARVAAIATPVLRGFLTT